MIYLDEFVIDPPQYWIGLLTDMTEEQEVEASYKGYARVPLKKLGQLYPFEGYYGVSPIIVKGIGIYDAPVEGNLWATAPTDTTVLTSTLFTLNISGKPRYIWVTYDSEGSDVLRNKTEKEVKGIPSRRSGWVQVCLDEQED